MARLSMTAPRIGISPFQAAYGLNRKLGQEQQAVIRVPELEELNDLSKPFLAGIRLSVWTNHMICVLETTPDALVVGDPISFGRKTWSWQQFEKRWSGVVIVSQ